MEQKLIDLIRENRSYRGFDETRKITREELLQMVEGARLSASSVNRQPLKYVLIYEPEKVAQFQPLTRWARNLPQLKLPHPGKCPTAFIVICQDKRIDENLNRYQRDIGIAAQSMLLLAVEMGLGGCMIGNFTAGDVHAQLKLPEEIVPMLIVAVGKPDEKIVLTEVEKDGNTAYYRDEDDTHYVPKRKLEDLIL